MINKIIPRQLDSTTDLKLTAENTMVDALNVRYSSNDTASGADGDDSSGDAGVLKNVKGNSRATFYNAFDQLKEGAGITHRTIGSVVDNKSKIIYFFVWSSDRNEHGIYAYDPYGKLPKNKTVPQGKQNSVRLILKSNQFNFPEDGFVSADIVHINRSEFEKYPVIENHMTQQGYIDDMNTDAIIYFTDNKNEPKKVNAYRALLDNAQQTTNQDNGYFSYTIQEFRDLVSSCPRTPLEKIKFEFGYDTQYLESNFKNTSGFQFAYQWIYKDGIESSISPYSSLAVPPVTLEQGAQTYVNYTVNNVCVLTLPPTNKEVDFIKILVREGDNGSWLVVDEVSTTDSSENWLHTESVYSFYNNKILVGVSAEEVAKQFDNVPKIAQCQVVSNNRLFYGNYVDSFDNVKVTAKITPRYSPRPTDEEIDIKIISGIRPHAIWKNEPLQDKLKKNKMYNAGANYIIDARGIPKLSAGDVVSLQLSIAPDRNFHIYKRKHFMPAPTIRTADTYFNEDDSYLPTNSSNQNLEYISTIIPGENFIQGANIWGKTIKDDLVYKYVDRSGTTKVVTKSIVGSSEENPLIIQGGQLEFNVSFQYEGDTVTNDEASAVVATTIAQMLAGYSEFTYPISILAQNNSYTHAVNLGLEDFTEITTSRSMLGVDNLGNAVTPGSSPDYRSNLICSIGDYSAAFVGNLPLGTDISEEFDDITLNPPIGYFIVNKATVDFSFDFVKIADGSGGSVVEILLCANKIKNLDLVTCVRSANAEAPWYVITKDFLNGNAGTPNAESRQQFLDEIGFSTADKFFQITPNAFGDEYNDWGNFNNLNNLYGIFNYTKQFGYLENLNNIDFSQRNKFDEQEADINIVGICLTDGESAAGGAVGGPNYNDGDFSKMGSISKVNRYFLPSQLSSWVNGYSYGTDANIGTNGGLLYAVGGVFFTGTNLKIAFVPRDVFSYIEDPEALVSIARFNQFGGKEKSTFMPLTLPAPLSNSRYISEQEYNEDIKYSEIETIYALFSGDTLKDYSEYRSFKSASSHEFGVIYYDERGRHGFVNPIGGVYVAGYSSQERPQGEQKGKVDIEISINSGTPPPPWARFYQFAHTRSTSVQDFVQYTAGGAFTSVGDTETEQNIYISLNYLQTSIVSYSSSFGARSPEGGLQLYKFKKGDRLRVISYKTTSEQIVYPNKYDFEIVDVVNIGDSNNPLHAGSTTPPFNKMGEFAIIKNNPTASPFDFASVKNGTDVWGNNCIIEIYTPSKISEQEQKIYYEIGPIKPVLSQGNQLIHGGGSTLLTEGDVWWRKVAVNFREYQNSLFQDILVDTLGTGGSNESKSNFKNYYLESKTFTDLVRADSIGIGRPNSVLKSARETRNESSITYSDQSAVSTTRPKYSSFNYSLLNYKDIPEVYGSINFMIDRGDSILVIQEDKVSYSPVLRNLLSDNANSEFLVSSTDVLGTSKFYAGRAGCDNNPESVVDVDGTVYFVHKSTAKVFKLTSTGIEDVSSTGMSSYLREMFNSILNTSSLVSKADIKVIGGYDPLNEEYVFTVKRIDVDPTRTNGNRIDVDSIDSPKKGCRNTNACNYDPDAKIDDGSCKFPIPGRNCAGECIDDIDGDDICDDRDPPIYGCTSPDACNYNPLANADDNSCVYAEYPYDCNNNCTEFHPKTNYGTISNAPYVIGPVCIDQTLVRGCMDPSYTNFDPNANYPYAEGGSYLCANSTSIAFPVSLIGQVSVGGGEIGTAGGNGQGGQAAVGGGSVGTAGGNSGVNVVGGGNPFAPTNTVVVNTIEKFIEYNGLMLSDIKEIFKFTKDNPSRIHEAFNTFDFNGDGKVGVADLLKFLDSFSSDANKDFIIPPSKPSGQAMTEQINFIIDKILMLHAIYQQTTTQVGPLVDVNVADYLLYLAGLSGPPESLITASGATISTNEPEFVTNLLDFLAGYTT